MYSPSYERGIYNIYKKYDIILQQNIVNERRRATAISDGQVKYLLDMQQTNLRDKLKCI